MKPFVLFNCFAVVLIQNAIAQTNYANNFGSVSLANGVNSLSNNKVSGNSVVSNTISIGNNNLANNAGNLASNKVGLSLASNNADTISLTGNRGTVSLAGNNAAGNSAPNLIDLSNFAPIRNEQRQANTVVGNSVVSNNIGIGNLNNGVNVQNLANAVSYNSLGNINLAGSNAASNFAANNVQLAGSTGRNVGVALSGAEFVETSVGNTYPEERQVIGYVTFEGYIPVDGTVSVASNGCDCFS